MTDPVLLLTGGRGFIGRHVRASLATSWSGAIHCVATAPPIDPAGHEVWHICDLLDPLAITRLIDAVAPSHLLHLAWYAEHGRFWSAPDNHAWRDATVALFDRFADRAGQRAVLAGTMAEYDWSRVPCSDTDDTSLGDPPSTLYGQCKLATARAVLGAASARSVSAAWGRVFMLHGPHEDPRRLVPHIVDRLRRGDPVDLTHGEQRRDISYVGDVADGFVALLGSAVTGSVNLAAGTSTRLRDLALELARQLDADPALLRFGAISSPPDDPPEIVATVGRLHDELGLRPRYSLAEGLAESVGHLSKRC